MVDSRVESVQQGEDVQSWSEHDKERPNDVLVTLRRCKSLVHDDHMRADLTGSLTTIRNTTAFAIVARAGGRAACQVIAVSLVNMESVRRLNPFLDVTSFQVVRPVTSISVTGYE